MGQRLVIMSLCESSKWGALRVVLQLGRKRVYEAAATTDGKRVLVDRLWPRGVSKEAAQIDVWLKDVAPSPALRTWFSHQPARFEGFSALYLQELKEDDVRRTAFEQLRDWAETERVTLVYAAKDPQVNHVTVLMTALGQGPRTD